LIDARAVSWAVLTLCRTLESGSGDDVTSPRLQAPGAASVPWRAQRVELYRVESACSLLESAVEGNSLGSVLRPEQLVYTSL